jgi:hypothetical protein
MTSEITKNEKERMLESIPSVIKKLGQIDATHLGFSYVARLSGDKNAPADEHSFKIKTLSVNGKTKKLIHESLLKRLEESKEE